MLDRRVAAPLGAGLTIACGLLIGAADAHAQTEFASWRVPGWSFTPSVYLGTTYDTNVALAGTPVIGETESDVLFTFTPAGQLQYNGRRTEFETGYRGQIRRYRNVGALNGLDQSVNASVRYMATKLVTVYVRNSFADVSTTDEVDLNGVPFVRTGSRTNSLSSGVEARISRHTSLAASYDLTWVNFDREDGLLADGYVNAFRGSLTRALGPRLSFGGEYSARFANLNDGLSRLRFQDAGGTLSYRLGDQTGISAGAGVSHLVDEFDDIRHTGPYFRVTIGHRTRRVIYNAGYQRVFVPSFGFGGSSSSHQLRGSVQMPLPDNRTYVQGSAQWRRSDPLLETELVLDTISVRSTVGRAILRWLRIEGFYAFTRQDSRITGGEVNRHRVGAGIFIAQPMRIR